MALPVPQCHSNSLRAGWATTLPPQGLIIKTVLTNLPSRACWCTQGADTTTRKGVERGEERRGGDLCELNPEVIWDQGLSSGGTLQLADQRAEILTRCLEGICSGRYGEE